MPEIGCVGFVVALALIACIRRLFSAQKETRQGLENLGKRLDFLSRELSRLRQEGSAPRPLGAEPAGTEAATPGEGVDGMAGSGPFSGASPAAVPPRDAPPSGPVPGPPTVFVPSPGPSPPPTAAPAAGGPSRPPSGPAGEPPPAPPSTPGFDWERVVGVKLFSWIAGIALVLAGAFFVRYSVEHGWLTPPFRLALGFAAGLFLLVLCEWKAARRYPVTANALDAAGIGLLYSTAYAAHAYWHVIDLYTAFGLLVLVTLAAVTLSIRHDSVFIALLGMLGGFAVPALLSTGVDRPFGLFGYLLLLNAGLAWVGRRQGWHFLQVLSLVLTTLYQWAWVDRFLTSGKLPVGAGVFFVFALFGWVTLILGRGRTVPGERSWVDRLSEAGTVLPFLFTLYWAVTPDLGARWELLFGLLFCLSAGLAAVALFRGPGLLNFAGSAATVTVVLAWVLRAWTPSAWPWVLAWTGAFVALHLGVPLLAHALKRDLDAAGNRAVFAAPLLLAVFPLLCGLEPATASPGLLFGSLFALLAAISAWAVHCEAGALHYLAVFFAYVTGAAWMATHLSPARVGAALALCAALTLYGLGVPLLARRAGAGLAPGRAGWVLLLPSLGFLFLPVAGPGYPHVPAGFVLVLLTLGAGLLPDAPGSRIPARLPAAAAVGLVLAFWGDGTGFPPGLLVTALCVAMMAFVTASESHRGTAVPEGPGEAARFAALAGKGLYPPLAVWFFLQFLAVRPAFSLPPLPLLVATGGLVLAFGLASLRLACPWPHLASLVLAALVLISWQQEASEAPWPTVAVGGVLVLAAFGVAWAGLARRVRLPGPARTGFDAASVAGLFAGLMGVSVTSSTEGPPAVGVSAAALVSLLVALLWTVSRRGWHGAAVAAAGVAALSVHSWLEYRSPEPLWWEGAFLGFAVYLVFQLYPVVLGRRGKDSLLPAVAAVASSAASFFLLRRALLESPLEPVIGLLPLTQAAFMGLILHRLLRLEVPGQRDLRRLALVAAALLAFVTVAIPLQLDKEWITLGWALEGAAVLALFRRVPHPGLVGFGTALLTAAFVRLAFNPLIFEYHPRGAVPVWNWYLYAYLVTAAALFFGARRLRGTAGDRTPFPEYPAIRLSGLFASCGTVLLFLLLNIEIADYHSTGSVLKFRFLGGTLAQDLSYTLGWAVFGVAMLVVGVLARNRPARVASLGLLLVTVFKAFLYDLSRLGGLYRVGSFVGLAVCLALVAVLVQKYVLAREKRD